MLCRVAVAAARLDFETERWRSGSSIVLCSGLTGKEGCLLVDCRRVYVWELIESRRQGGGGGQTMLMERGESGDEGVAGRYAPLPPPPQLRDPVRCECNKNREEREQVP